MKLPKINVQTLQKIRRPKVKRRNLLISLVLIVSFSSALMIRMTPAEYGFYLNEFDPYFNYYATNFIVKNAENHGLGVIFSDDPNINYFKWRDYMTWYPEGRAVASTSQGGLHFAGATLYLLFKHIIGINISLYDFLVLFPVFFGALTVFAIFLLARKISGTGAGLIASLIVAFSPPLIFRGNLGWYKSEPFALFLTVLSAYFFLSIFSPKVTKSGLALRAIISGLLLGYANASWGGVQYFNGVMGLVFLISPFLDVDLKRVINSGSMFTASNLIVSSAFPRPGPSIIFASGIVLFAGLAFAMLAFYVKSVTEPKNHRKALIISLVVLALLGLFIISSGLIPGLSGRYLTAIFPFQRTADPLIESVAEHQTSTGANFLISFWVLIFLGAFGAFTMLKKRAIFSAYALILGITSLYVASSFSRLMVYSSIAFAILAGTGFSELSSSLLKPTAPIIAKKRLRAYAVRPEVKVISAIFIISLLASANYYWIPQYDAPATIAISGLQYDPGFPVTDWLEALTWIRENTPENAVIIAWWDYGYWITVMGNRTSLADNATINSTRIQQIGKLFMSNETEAKEIIKQLAGDRPAYIAVFFSATKWQDKVLIGGAPPFLLNLGGDEGKISWFASIPRLNVSQYVRNDGLPTEYFWNSTLLGKMFPLDYDKNLSDSMTYQYSQHYQRYVPIQVGTYTIKYQDGSGLLKLAFASSFKSYAQVLIYQVVE
ncbi:MAG: STT3 domain-containing protein [Nitrososphaerales archaeon]